MTEQEKATALGAQLEEAERLRIEVIYLKLVNLELQVKGLDIQKAVIVEQMKALQADMEKERQALSAKYGVDINRTSVKADGTINRPAQQVPATAVAPPAPAQVFAEPEN